MGGLHSARMTVSRSTQSTMQSVRVLDVRPGESTDRVDQTAVEEPLEIRVVPGTGGASHRIAVTMRTPGEDFELAAGFLMSEGLLHHPGDVTRIAYCTEPGVAQEYNIVNVTLAPKVRFDSDQFRRNFFATSSCGICGKAAIEQVQVAVPRSPVGQFRIPSDVLTSLPPRLTAAQRIFGRTGGLHAAALFRPEGDLIVLREDVGRHNAVDKVVGHQFLGDALPATNTILLVSGRAGFELVQKAAVAGIPFLAAIGAPSSLAVALAREQGMTLVGFLREGRFNVYAGDGRVEV